jgi:hypothetical protein
MRGTALFYLFSSNRSVLSSFLIHYGNYKTIENDQLSKTFYVYTTRTFN